MSNFKIQSETKRSNNGGYSFYDGDSDKWYLVRCHECGRENYAMSVSSGVCAWCGYNDNPDQALAEIK